MPYLIFFLNKRKRLIHKITVALKIILKQNNLNIKKKRRGQRKKATGDAD